MGDPRLHTKHYDLDARLRLGIAVTRAREASGHPFRPSFVEVCGISLRSLAKLESGDPVGPGVYEAVARALPGWTEDTPRRILEDKNFVVPIVDLVLADPEEDKDSVYIESDDEPPVGSDKWLLKYSYDAESVRAGIEVRLKQEELDRLIRKAADRAAQVAERELSDEQR